MLYVIKLLLYLLCYYVVECLHEIRLFFSETHNNYIELSDLNWLYNLKFFTDFD